VAQRPALAAREAPQADRVEILQAEPPVDVRAAWDGQQGGPKR
jgi:hypothetical protein